MTKAVLRSPFNLNTGYGRDGIGLHRAMEARGWDVYLDPTTISPPVPDDTRDYLSKTLRGRADLVIHHVPPKEVDGHRAHNTGSPSVLWTMWEQPWLPLEPWAANLKRDTAAYDLLVGYDESTALTFSSLTHPKKWEVLLGGFEPDLWEPTDRDWLSQQMWVLWVGPAVGRKNAADAIYAVEKARSWNNGKRDIRLTMKVGFVDGLDLLRRNRGWLSIIPGHISDQEMLELHHQHHILLSTSSGEGKNLPAMQHAATGGVVVATKVGGHKTWLWPEAGVLTPVRYLPNARMTIPDTDASAEALATLFDDRPRARRLGYRAARLIPEDNNWDKVLDRLVQLLRKNGTNL